jgi:iron complex outermembrane recepter protein
MICPDLLPISHPASRSSDTLLCAALLCVALLTLTGTPARAQAPGAAARPPLEEIVVEATRIEKTLDHVASAVSIVGEDDIQLGRQQLGLDESLARVPGLFMQNRYNFAQDLRVSIRGFGARANFGIRGIKILVDGIPETLPDGQGQVDSIDLGATREIEVIRGPSSSLYGNASGGVISVTSEGATEPYIETRLSAGAYDFHRLQVKAGTATEHADYFVSLSDGALDGYREHSRAENTQLTARAHFDLGGDRDLLTVLNYTDQPISDDPGGVTAALAATDPTAAWPANVSFDAGEALTQSRLGFVYKMALGEGELAARNYYVWRDFGNKLPTQSGGIVDLQRFFAGGGLSYSYDGAWLDFPNRLIVGIDYDDQDDDRKRFDNNAGVQGNATLDQNEHVQSRGIFLQDELSFSEALTLSFGVRYDDVVFDVTDKFLSDGNDSGSRTLNDVSPMLGISVLLAPNLSFYGTYSTAFETPTTTEFNRPDGGGGFNLTLDPQLATNTEVGLRGGIGERQSFEAALFHIEVKDELIPFEVPTSPGRDYFVNAGKSRRNGIELSYAVQATDRVRATVSYTYSDFEFTQFIDEAGTDFSGNAMPGAPKNQLFAELSYTHPRGWYAALDALYIDEQFTNNANSVINPSYTVANLRVGFERDIGQLTISPFIGINNLLDEAYNANVRLNAFGGRYFEAGPDRNSYGGVSIRHRFR